MINLKLFRFVMIMFLGLIIIAACEKTDDQIKSGDITIVDDDVSASLLYDQAFNEVDMALEQLEFIWANPSIKKSVQDTCPIIYVDHNDSTYWPKTVTIDFGTDGCEGPWGTIRKGKIIIHITGRYLREGSVRTVTLVDFSVNGFQVEGTRTTTNEGRNDDEFLVFSIVLEDGKVTTPEGIEITRGFTRTRTWIEGEQTPRWRWDDKYLIDGEATGINRLGKTYTRTIIEPLLVATSCRWIMSGTVEIQPEDRSLILLDFGTGECDDLATVTVDGVTEEITLKGKKRRNP